MVITDVDVIPVHVPLRSEWRISSGSRTHSDYVIVRVTADCGIAGVGEASPVCRYAPETQESIFYAIKHYLGPSIIGMNPENIQSVHDRMNGVMSGNLFAKAAVDMALYDLLGKAYGLPCHMLLGGRFRDRVPIAYVVGIKPFDHAARDIEWAVEHGFRTLKIKVGQDIRHDSDFVERVRRLVGPEMKITVDANAGWKTDEAIRNIRILEEWSIDSVEQPVPGWDIRGMRRVRQAVRTRIMADESIYSTQDALRLVENDAVDIMNIYIAKAGSMNETKKVAAICESAGLSCLVGGMVELGVGTAASLQFVAAVESIDLPNYIAGPIINAADIVREEFGVADGCLTVPHGAGLGVTLSEDKLAQFSVAI
jgi:o-succinylbenzoate synthase